MLKIEIPPIVTCMQNRDRKKADKRYFVELYNGLITVQIHTVTSNRAIQLIGFRLCSSRWVFAFVRRCQQDVSTPTMKDPLHRMCAICTLLATTINMMPSLHRSHYITDH